MIGSVLNDNKDSNGRNVDNTPSWIAGRSRHTFSVDKPRKPPAFMINIACCNTNPENRDRPIHIAIDDELPAIAMRFGTSYDNEIKFYVSVDSCVGLK